MAPKQLRQTIGAVKDQTTIGLAKITSSDLQVAIVKATRHQETPPNEDHILEILSLSSSSRALVHSTIKIIGKRLNKTNNWIVALKSLMLVQQLLAEGGYAYVEEIFFSTRRGTRFLSMYDFRDSSLRCYAWDFSAFVRTYAMYLDEQVEFKMQGRRRSRPSTHWEDEEDADAIWMRTTPVCQTRNDLLLIMANHVKQLIQRFLACKPTGAAKHNKVVGAALYPDMAHVYEIFYGVSIQYDELDAFYDWCKDAGIGCTSEYPDVEKIPQKKLDMMEDIMLQKSAMLRYKTAKPIPEMTTKLDPDEDMFAIKALPMAPQEGSAENEEKREEKNDNQHIGDLVNLCEEITTSISGANALREWEITLFCQNEATKKGCNNNMGDPFAASIGVAPPTYVQMAEMEKKQRLIAEERLIWQQYARDGMQGQMGLARIQQQFPYGYITATGTGVYSRMR